MDSVTNWCRTVVNQLAIVSQFKKYFCWTRKTTKMNYNRLIMQEKSQSDHHVSGPSTFQCYDPISPEKNETIAWQVVPHGTGPRIISGLCTRMGIRGWRSSFPHETHIFTPSAPHSSLRKFETSHASQAVDLTFIDRSKSKRRCQTLLRKVLKSTALARYERDQKYHQVLRRTSNMITTRDIVATKITRHPRHRSIATRHITCAAFGLISPPAQRPCSWVVEPSVGFHGGWLDHSDVKNMLGGRARGRRWSG